MKMLPTSARLPTRHGEFLVSVYEDPCSGLQHVALIRGKIDSGPPVLTRLHSECFTGDVLGSLRCDCSQQLHLALERITEEGRGVLLYLRQEGRGIGLFNKISAYALQDRGLDTVEANERLGLPIDGRDYRVAGAILQNLGVGGVRLLTNNPCKVDGLRQAGIDIVERLPLVVPPTSLSGAYLRTKQLKLGHVFD